MLRKQPFQVAGVDGCKAGWFVAIVSITTQGRQTNTSTSCVLKLKSVLVAGNFAEVLSKTGDCKLVCVDIPIGLSEAKPRECDLAARKILGGRRASSIFPPPIRACLAAKDPETASEICFRHSGKKLNRQSLAILDKIRQVDELMTPALQRRVCEIHPEISFWALNHKKPLQHKKRSLTGRRERMKLLSPVFSDVERIVAEARKPREAAPDDILDALVAAWTAGQAVMGRAVTLPENPELDRKGIRMEILCPIAIIDVALK